MRQETINIYKFEELSEESQEKAIEKLYDLNVSDSFWYECLLDDAATIGMKITAFDIDRESYLDAEWLEYFDKVAELILKNHGETCETYTLAREFLDNLNQLTGEEGEKYGDEKVEELEKEFERALREEYLSMLRREWEYLTSKEAIKESILANEYEFLENGDLA